MKLRPLSVFVLLLLIASFVLSACAPAAAPRSPRAATQPQRPAGRNRLQFPRPRLANKCLKSRHHDQHRRLRPARCHSARVPESCVTAASMWSPSAPGKRSRSATKGDADVLLVHARKSEDQFVERWDAKERFDTMYNDFILLGPKDDPAKIASTASAKDAFNAILNAEAQIRQSWR